MNTGLAALVLALAPLAGAAADFNDPSWPCIQRKVERLSPGLMWPGEIPEMELSQEAEDLAEYLSLRRVTLDEAREAVTAYVASHPEAGPDQMGAIFGEVFDRMSRIRRKVMSGIANYAESQVALSQRIEAAQDEMSALENADAPDFDRMDALEEQLAWDERIYRDRERSLTYVCETPVLIEKRLYAIAQILQQAEAG